jgi:hypothetical protein
MGPSSTGAAKSLYARFFCRSRPGKLFRSGSAGESVATPLRVVSELEGAPKQREALRNSRNASRLWIGNESGGSAAMSGATPVRASGPSAHGTI